MSILRWILALCAGAALLWAFYDPAWSQDRGAWFKSLRAPDTGVSCCDISDCKPTTAEWRDTGWMASLPDGRMVEVPASKIVKDPPSIDGNAYLCAGPLSGRIYCFIPPHVGF